MAEDETNPVMNNTGLTDDQCKEVHGFFMKGITIWVIASAVAHMLTYSWMPWFPGAN